MTKRAFKFDQNVPERVAAQQLVPTLVANGPRGQLWIVEDGRIRVRDAD